MNQPPAGQSSGASAFEVLGIPESATPAEVAARYRELMEAWRPERYGENLHLQRVAEDRRRDIQAAYDSLRERAAAQLLALPATEPAAPQPPPVSRREVWRRRALFAAVVLAGTTVVCPLLVRYVIPRQESKPAAPAPAVAHAARPNEPAAPAPAPAPHPVRARMEPAPRVVAVPNGADLMPAAGRVGSGTIRIVNRSDRDAVATVTARGRAVHVVYIAAGAETAVEKLGADVYVVNFQLGRDWVPARRRFARDRSSAGPYGPFTFVEVEGVSGRRSDHYEIVLRGPG